MQHSIQHLKGVAALPQNRHNIKKDVGLT